MTQVCKVISCRVLEWRKKIDVQVCDTVEGLESRLKI